MGTDGRTDGEKSLTKIKVTFFNFPNSPSVSHSFHFTVHAFPTLSIVSIIKLTTNLPMTEDSLVFLSLQFRSVMWSVRNTCCINVPTRYRRKSAWSMMQSYQHTQFLINLDNKLSWFSPPLQAVCRLFWHTGSPRPLLLLTVVVCLVPGVHQINHNKDWIWRSRWYSYRCNTLMWNTED